MLLLQAHSQKTNRYSRSCIRNINFEIPLLRSPNVKSGAREHESDVAPVYTIPSAERMVDPDTTVATIRTFDAGASSTSEKPVASVVPIPPGNASTSASGAGVPSLFF